MFLSQRFVNRTVVCAAVALIFFALSAEELDAQKGKADADGKTVWYDCKLMPITGKGWETTESNYDRFPAKAKATIPSGVWNLSKHSAGLCVHFSTHGDTSIASKLRVRWTLLKSDLAMPHMPATGVSGVDFYVKDAAGKWRFINNGRPKVVANVGNGETAFDLAPDKECLLYLPLYNGVTSVEIGLPKNNTLSPVPAKPERKPIVFYGTSITQGGCASRPGMAATAIVGRELDFPVINLGFSGSGKMEPELADLLMELDPSVYVLDCLWNMDPKMVSDRLEPFVRKLRAARPATPILLAEDSSVKNITPTEKGRILRTIIEKLEKDGIKSLYFVSNAEMLGTDGEGTVDGVHPNDLGMMRQAVVFLKALEPILKHP